MYESLDMKINYSNRGKPSFCEACLSADRKLSSINEYVDIYLNICGISHFSASSQILLCWECTAVLKRIKLFKTQVEEAQSIIRHLSNKQNYLNSLSRLTKTYTQDAIYITYDDETKPKLDIKEEIDQIDDNFEPLSDEYSPQDIKNKIKINSKKEIKINSKKEIKNKSHHYRYVYDYGVTKKTCLLRKKLCINESEIELWLDRERSSEFYKKLKYKCKYCVQGWNLKEKLEAHNLKYHDECIGPYICRFCCSRFATKSAQCVHTISHCVGYECAYCGHQCYTTTRFNAHLDTHRKVQCVYCNTFFDDVPQFFKHYTSMHTMFLCDHCGKSWKSKHMLAKHMSHHSDSHTCNACHKRYKSLSALREHFSMKHSSSPAEQAYCVLCDKQYDNALVYKRHVQSSIAHAHERDRARAKKSIPCPDCGNTYSRRTYMMNHYRHVHMNQSKYYCGECNKHFLNRTKYVDHMKYNHEGLKKEKNKLCNICGKGFSTNRILLNHIRIHSGERPFECESCGAKFTQKHSMLSHVKYIHLKSSRRSHC